MLRRPLFEKHSLPKATVPLFETEYEHFQFRSSLATGANGLEIGTHFSEVKPIKAGVQTSSKPSKKLEQVMSSIVSEETKELFRGLRIAEQVLTMFAAEMEKEARNEGR